MYGKNSGYLAKRAKNSTAKHEKVQRRVCRIQATKYKSQETEYIAQENMRRWQTEKGIMRMNKTHPLISKTSEANVDSQILSLKERSNNAGLQQNLLGENQAERSKVMMSPAKESTELGMQS